MNEITYSKVKQINKIRFVNKIIMKHVFNIFFTNILITYSPMKGWQVTACRLISFDANQLNNNVVHKIINEVNFRNSTLYIDILGNSPGRQY